MEKGRERIKKEIKLVEAELLELRKLAALKSSLPKPLSQNQENKSYNFSLPRNVIHKNGSVLSKGVQHLPNNNNNNNGKVGHWSFFIENKILDWSPEVYQIFEYPEFYKGTLSEFYFESIDEKTASRFLEMHEIFNGRKGNNVMSQTIITPSGKKKFLSISSVPLRNDRGEQIGVKGTVKDVTDEVVGKNGLDNFFGMSTDLHCITHIDRYFIKVSPAWTALLGYSEEELLSHSYLDFIHPEDIIESNKAVANVVGDGWSNKFENRYLTKSGEVVYLSWRARHDSETGLAYCTARDITELKIARDELISDLSGKDLLLREIHHRVKNNLQIITSLLSLQANANEEEEHLNKLYEDSRNRIQSMAAIHEMFYESEQLDKIDVRKYLNKLLNDLSVSFALENRAITFSMEIDSVFVNLDTAIPLGLVINEILTNSIKYGGDADGNVSIFVEIESLDNNKFQIIIGDKGINSKKDILNQQVESLGVLLINSLVEQIDGEIEQLTDRGGTVFKLSFKNSVGTKTK